MNRLLYVLLQLTWGLPQTLVGFIVFLLTAGCPHTFFFGSVCTVWKLKSSLSLGLFIFISDDSSQYSEYQSHKAAAARNCIDAYDGFNTMLAVHEYGHTIQSLIWGPLYLLSVGLPSLVWAKLPVFGRLRRRESISYYDIYPEKQANRLGELSTGLKAPTE